MNPTNKNKPKSYKVESGSDPVHIYCYILKCTKYKIDRRKIVYFEKKIKKDPNIVFTLKSCFKNINLDNMPNYEQEQKVSIWIHSNERILRRPHAHFEHNLYLYTPNISNLEDIEIIYSFIPKNQFKTKNVYHKNVFFQSVGMYLNRDFQELELAYFTDCNTDKINLKTIDAYLRKNYKLGVNMNMLVGNIMKKNFCSSAVNYVTLLLDTNKIELDCNDLVVFSIKYLSKKCPQPNCLYSSLTQNKRHFNSCTSKTKINYTHIKVSQQKSIRTLLQEHKYFTLNESTLTKHFAFIHFTTMINPDTNETYVFCVSVYSNISGSTTCKTFDRLTWVDQCIKFFKWAIKSHRHFVLDNANSRCKKTLLYVLAQKEENDFFKSQKKSACYQIEQYFRNLLKVKIMCNNLQFFYDKISEFSALCCEEFKILNKKRSIIGLSNNYLAFYHVTAYLVEDQLISTLSSSWLNEPDFLDLPKTLLLNPTETQTNHFPALFDLIEKDCYNKNVEAFNQCDSSLAEYVTQYSSNAVVKLHRVICQMSHYYNDYFDIDLFNKCTLSSLAYSALLQFYDKTSIPIHTFDKRHETYALSMREYCWGGLNFILRQHLTTLDSSDFPKAASHTPNGEKINEILMYDINSNYVTALLEDMPCGIPGVLEKQENGSFKYSTGVVGDNCSAESLQWLEYEENELNKLGFAIQIQHAMNGGEAKVSDVGKVDGFAIINGVCHYWEYDGCFYHKCERCYPHLEYSDYEEQIRIQIRDEQKRYMLGLSGTVHHMRSCQWKKIKKDIKFKPKAFHLMDTITEEDLLSPSFFGFISVDLFLDKDIIRKFEWLNLPLLFDRREIEGKIVTIPSYKSTILIYTPLLEWYLNMGVKINNINYAISYQKSKPFKKFALRVQELRQKAYDMNDIPLTEAIKLIGNSATGRLGMRQDKNEKIAIKNAKEAGKSLRNARSVDIERINENQFRVQSRYKSKQITSLTHVYNAVLQLSKLDLYQKIFGLAMLSRPGAFSLAYMDTDSFTIGFQNDGSGLSSIVSDEKMADWITFEKCLVSSKSDCKTLGLLKVEHKVIDGHFVVKGTKQYLFYEHDITKQAVVGLRKHKQLTLQTFLDAVYNDQAVNIEQVKCFNKNNKIFIKAVNARFLSKPYNKGARSSNKIDIFPFDSLTI